MTDTLTTTSDGFNGATNPPSVSPEQLKDFFQDDECTKRDEAVADYVDAADRDAYIQCVEEMTRLAEQGQLESCLFGSITPRTSGDQFMIELLTGEPGPDSDVIDIHLKSTISGEAVSHFTINREGLANILKAPPQGNDSYWVIMFKKVNTPPEVRTFRYAFSEKFLKWFCETDVAEPTGPDAPTPASN